MKKISLLLAFILCAPLLIAQNIDKAFNALKDEPNCVYQYLTAEILQGLGEELKSTLGEFDIEEAKVLVFDEATPETFANYHKKTSKLKRKKGFEPLVKVNDEEDQVLVLGKMANEVIKELLIFVEDETDIVFVWAKGNFHLDQLDKVIQLNK